MAKLGTLSDTFAAPALNLGLWNASSAAPNVTLDAALDRVAVACTTSYYSLASTPWDATGSGLYARVTPAPLGNGTTETFLELVLDASNKASLLVSGGVFQARVTNAGVNTTTTIGANWAAYDQYNYAWWRIAQAGGSFVFSVSPDGYTWTTRATIAHTWSAASVKAQFVSGYYGTEAASSAYIDHVNTTVSAFDQINLAWPRIDDGWGPLWTVSGGSFPLDRLVDVSDRTRNSAGFSRGRQYETDQVRAGEAQLELANPDAALDPDNTSGPWAGSILPYQPYRRRAQWPPTRNLLDQVAATAGDLGGYSLGTIPTSSDIFSATDSSNGSFVSSATAWQGGTVMQFAVPNGTAAPTRICHTPRPSVKPGQTYTVTLRVRNVTASTSLSVQPFISWYTVAGGFLPATFTYGTSASLTGSTTAAWTTLTVTATAPANVAGIGVGVALAANAAAACSVQVDGWQAEYGSTATTWQCPGVWYPLYAGYMERWPSKWDMDGTYGMVAPSAVDAFSLLSQQKLSDPLSHEINGDSPRFLYKLDDPSGVVSAADWTGNFPPAQLRSSKYGAGTFAFGTEITSTTPSGTFTGSTGTVATLSNPFPGQSVISPSTFLSLTTAGIKGPANPALWTRAIAFRYTGPTPVSFAWLWSTMDGQRSGGSQSGSRIHMRLDSSGRPVLNIGGPSGANGSYFAGGATNCVDGDWHLLIFAYNEALGQVMVSQDGSVIAFYSGLPATYTPSGIISDCIGAYVDATVGNGVICNFQGDIAFAAEFNTWFNSTATTGLYQAWKSAFTGEATNARYARILRYAGYTGATNIQAGLTTSMGPAAFTDTDCVTALQAVVDTEGGSHFVDRAGAVCFRSRSSRYNATTPTVIFGEREDLGEVPYETCETDFDPTHLSNEGVVTQESTGQLFYANDATSIARYFPRDLTRTVNSSSSDECQDAANYYVSRYRQPATRISALKLHPSANPALWPVLLGLELGTRARVMRRPPGVPAKTVDVFVESVAWDFDDENEAWVSFQCSPADTTPYGVIAAWHTTLATSPAAGVTSVTVNAGQDNTNLLAAQLAPGQLLVLGQGTANQETVTVLTVGATSPGWTTATVTLTAATTKAHTSGDTVCEPLPAGTTDPTTWDAVARLDQVAFAY